MPDEKDPFADYDHFWNELDQASEPQDEKKSDSKEHLSFDHFEQKENNRNDNGYNVVKILLIIIGFIIFSMIAFTSIDTGFGNIALYLPKVLMITIVAIIVKGLINKNKHK